MPFGYYSLLPPLLAIFLAIVSRRVVVPLIVGIICGAVIIANDSDRATTTWTVFWSTTWGEIYDLDHTQVLIFSLLFGAMVGVLEVGTGIRILIRQLSGYIKNRRDAQSMIGLSGLLIFFDDYANTLLVGATMRSTADKFRVSRAKLAYLVDSTAAPVAGLALVSTWAVTELNLLEEGLSGSGIDKPGLAYQLFISSIPHRLYPLLAIGMVFIVARSGRDFGPMRVAEQECIAASPRWTSQTDAANASLHGHWASAVLPIIACIGSILAMMVWSGAKETGPDVTFDSMRSWTEILGNANAYQSLILGGTVGLSTAVLMYIAIPGRDEHGTHTHQRCIIGSLRGAWQMMPAMVVLYLAWTLSKLTQESMLDTGGYLASLINQNVATVWLPTIVFIVASATAVSTGTSWGTMAILVPVSVSTAVALSGATPDLSLITATFSSVLAGAIFGDHCSPISDTTVLSSRATGCDHILHVKTQMPYALTCGLLSVFGISVTSLTGISPWLTLLGCLGMAAVVVRLLGKPPVIGKPPETDTRPIDADPAEAS